MARRNVPLATAAAASIAALALLAVHVWVHPLPGLEALERATIDARFRVRGPRAPETDRIVIVGLDDKTRARAPEVFQTRAAWATLIDRLTAYDPKLVALDLYFDAPEVLLPGDLDQRVRAADQTLAADDPARPLVHEVAEALRGDDKLGDAIARSKRVYAGASFSNDGERGPEPASLALARIGEVADAGGGGDRRPVAATSVAITRDAIGHGVAGVGAVNAIRDADGVSRRVPLAQQYGGHDYMPLGLVVAAKEMGADTSYVVGERTMRVGDKHVSLGTAATAWLDVLGPDAFPRVSAADVLDGTAPRDALAGKLVFVGFTYSAFDKVTTSLDPLADGVELHATLAENVLADRVMTPARGSTTALATLLLCAIVVAAQLRRVRKRAWVPPVVALLAFVTYAAIAQLLFARGTIIDLAAPTLLAAMVLSAATIGGLATEGREKAQLRATFSRYVSREVVDRILADPARMKLGGERKELTVLFSDIRGFSAFSERMPPETLASFLSEYLTPMTELVHASGGTLDKYIGDAVMALWSAPLDVPDHATRACEVALRMQEILVELNREWKREDKPPVAIGIGLNTGVMAVGNMGSAARFDYTAIGDQVNLAARLEGLTKEYGVGILAGEATVRAATGFAFREIDVVRVKGRAGSAPVFELVGRAGAKLDDRFPLALAAYRKRDFATARDAFALLSGDPVAVVMAARCAVLTTTPPPDDWDGVYEQRGK